MHSRRGLTDDLRALGLLPGDTVMVHASVRAVGDVAGGPDEIHLAIKDAITPDGTLLMYASCPRHYDEVGRGNLTPEDEAEVLEKLPPFDPMTARAARENGVLVEFLRTYPGSRVNHHVARFVAWGQQVDRLFATQPWDYALGHGSALERLVELDGRILLLGCDHDTVTFLHYAEHVSDVPSRTVTRYLVPVLERGGRVWRAMEEIDTNVAHPNWPERFFARIVDQHLRRTGNPGRLVGNARSHLMSARALLDRALPIMRQLALDHRVADQLLGKEEA